MVYHHNKWAKNATDKEIAGVARDFSGDINHIKYFKYECPYCGHKWSQKNPEHGEPREVLQEEIDRTRETLRTVLAMSPPTGERQQKVCSNCKKPFNYYPLYGDNTPIPKYEEGHTDIRGYYDSEGDPVYIKMDKEIGRITIDAPADPYASTIDLLDVIDWVKENMPELLEEKQ